MAFFDDLHAVVAIVDKANTPADIDFDHLIHAAFDVSVNVFISLEKKKVSDEYAAGVRDGLDAMLALVVKDSLGVDDERAFHIVHAATKACMEKHKKEHAEHMKKAEEN